eukprot:COSAG02_NODE_359_length_23842_cov_22.550011_15_plen_93_part_00
MNTREVGATLPPSAPRNIPEVSGLSHYLNRVETDRRNSEISTGLRVPYRKLPYSNNLWVGIYIYISGGFGRGLGRGIYIYPVPVQYMFHYGT